MNEISCINQFVFVGKQFKDTHLRLAQHFYFINIDFQLESAPMNSLNLSSL